MADVPDWLDNLERQGNRAARWAINKGRTAMPPAGKEVTFDPICRVGASLRWCKGHRAKVVETFYTPPDDPAAARFFEATALIEFGDGRRHTVAVWHLVEA